MEKLEWYVGLAEGEKRFENIFTNFDTIHESDRRTDGRTDEHRTTAQSALYIASRGKNGYTALSVDKL